MGKTEGGKERMYSFCIKLVHFFFSGNPREAMICLFRFMNASLPNCYSWGELWENFFMFTPTEQHSILGKRKNSGIRKQSLQELTSTS